MSNFIEIDYSGLQRAAEAFQRAPEIAREELAAAMTEADALLATQAEAYAPIGASGGQGGLAASITHIEQINETGVIGIVGSPLNYAEAVELGTRPHFPPIEPLLDWVKVKLNVAEKDARNVAFLVARKISRTGTKGQHMFQRALDQQEAAIESIFRRALDRIGARLARA